MKKEADIMIIELDIDWRRIEGNKAVKFGVLENDETTRGTLIVGRGGLQWRGVKGHAYPTKSWDEVIDWLEQHD